MEHQSQTDLDIPCEQSGEAKGKGARKSSHTEMEDDSEFECISEYHHTLPQSPRGVVTRALNKPIFHDPKIMFLDFHLEFFAKGPFFAIFVIFKSSLWKK